MAKTLIAQIQAYKAQAEAATEGPRCGLCQHFVCEAADLGLGYCNIRPESRYAIRVSENTKCKMTKDREGLGEE